uniref:Uncharacterized protein n=2 Tax=Aegilops tauschii subsp. strangulata TaxID=200361 RepID=A0A453JKE7_AEGTS
MTNGSGGMDLTITGDGRCLCAVPLLAIKWIWDKGFGIVNVSDQAIRAFHPPDFVKEVCRNNNIAKLHRLCNTNIPKIDVDLLELHVEWGEEVYKAAVNCLVEIEECGMLADRTIIPEI